MPYYLTCIHFIYNLTTIDLKTIYSNDDLGHYWLAQAVIYCGWLLIPLESCCKTSEQMLLVVPGSST